MIIRKRHKIISILLAALAGQVLVLQAQALDLRKVEKEIHRLTNEMRAEKGLKPLAPMRELDGLARAHSRNMAENDFFDHVDPDGNSPFDRMKKNLPTLLTMGAAENIAMRSISGAAELALAKGLSQQWRHSPGHYRNIMKPAYLQLGVGVAAKDGDIYATQNFAAGLVMLEQDLPGRIQAGGPVRLSFRYLADFPPDELSVFLNVPDAEARFPTAGGSFYTGGGPLQPVWKEKQRFELNIPTSYGLGVYSLGIGRNGSYYPTPFSFEAVKQLGLGLESGRQAAGRAKLVCLGPGGTGLFRGGRATRFRLSSSSLNRRSP
ncbi:MAG TPA: CAP domain-containing protein [Candidatus Obscuribacterales bacterium]